MKQEKGRVIVILTRSIKIEKSFPGSNKYHDRTDSVERKVQRTLRKVKTKLPPNIYSKVYPTSSSPSKLYATAKNHKTNTNGKVNDLLIRTAISNIGTATYHLAKYLAQLLKPLSES